MNLILTLLSILSLIAIALGRQGFGPTDQEWGFVTVRPKAHMFWWLHKTTANVTDYKQRPLLIWLQGGPGSSSAGYGNFAELGPLDLDLKPRQTAWTNSANVLFVDNPVGSGFSYTDSYDALATNNQQIADDFIVLLQNFYQTLPEFKQIPLYIFCESYGGKMTSQIALAIHDAVKAGKLDVKLKGIGLGDSWISPLDSVLTWAPYLLNVGAIDQNGYKKIVSAANAVKAAFDEGSYEKSTSLWGLTENLIDSLTGGIDFYNILTKISMKPSPDEETRVDYIMNNYVRDALKLNVTFGTQANSVFTALQGDFMKPVTDVVETLLNTTDIKVAVYNGQLDLIVDTPGTVAWVNVLKFSGSSKWENAKRSSFVVDDTIEGYVKTVDNLSMFWVDRAGHMVPKDNPAGMMYILKNVTNNFSVD